MSSIHFLSSQYVMLSSILDIFSFGFLSLSSLMTILLSFVTFILAHGTMIVGNCSTIHQLDSSLVVFNRYGAYCVILSSAIVSESDSHMSSDSSTDFILIILFSSMISVSHKVLAGDEYGAFTFSHVSWITMSSRIFITSANPLIFESSWNCLTFSTDPVKLQMFISQLAVYRSQSTDVSFHIPILIPLDILTLSKIH
jgi:hypothetical protein